MKVIAKGGTKVTNTHNPNELDVAVRQRVLDYEIRSSRMLLLLHPWPPIQEWYHDYITWRTNRKYKRYISAKRQNAHMD